MKRFSPIEAIIFDMDGTLIDTEVIFRKAEPLAAALFDIEVTEEILHQMVGIPEHEIMKLFTRIFGPQFPVQKFRNEFYRLADELIEKEGLSLKTGAAEILAWCHEQKFSKAIATSASYERAKAYLERTGLFSEFDAIVSGDMINLGKPNPDIYLRAAEMLKVDPARCLAIEDSHNGIRSAQRAGMLTVMIPDLMPVTEEMKNLSDAIFPDFHHLLVELKQRIASSSLASPV